MTVSTTEETITATTDDEAATATAPATAAAPETLVESDLLVEDVSIDGMCGVY
jgi:mycofactocin precursor